MKFKYLLLTLDGEAPQGTNDFDLVKQLCQVEDAWVVNCETGEILGADGQPEADLDEVNSNDYEVEEEDEVDAENEVDNESEDLDKP